MIAHVLGVKRIRTRQSTPNGRLFCRSCFSPSCRIRNRYNLFFLPECQSQVSPLSSFQFQMGHSTWVAGSLSMPWKLYSRSYQRILRMMPFFQTCSAICNYLSSTELISRNRMHMLLSNLFLSWCNLWRNFLHPNTYGHKNPCPCRRQSYPHHPISSCRYPCMIDYLLELWKKEQV